ncbi:sigma factor [Xanthomonas graminis]|jgi:alkylhydroperoxidase family enzyme|uniref:RNA polymerase sigma-70 region 2 domain-containing protein n=1 Tax=Xanthomonas graminis pv. graminis TaxID=134874 RepID=A0A1M4IIT6_9XANT|nr:sigma factor [Xanthomonas translucens]EKU25100.1 hypothetical protein XTG29_01959 [Xanthomonas translucens pv. graminis ART-Xtg29]OAX60464.1 hypothetical protein A6R72_14460 [Xanthomonas translucens pv. graminis]SBV42139.1 hypothetical protein XTGART2_2017 [Xanthomonas translucens pv. graminis]SBV42797.1 hypothetical protein XTGART9_2017 [Xanthomonas translucens pv. graminis]SBV47408.1 hypothetical protein XTGART29_2048 [Xanthomonas translucens pv. graminis ART-Xtg29]
MRPDPTFESQRPRLFGLAYRLLGNRSDAEDVPQDAYDALSAHFDEHGIRALTMAIAIINAWNRLGVGLQPAMP